MIYQRVILVVILFKEILEQLNSPTAAFLRTLRKFMQTF